MGTKLCLENVGQCSEVNRQKWCASILIELATQLTVQNLKSFRKGKIIHT